MVFISTFWSVELHRVAASLLVLRYEIQHRGYKKDYGYKRSNDRGKASKYASINLSTTPVDFYGENFTFVHFSGASPGSRGSGALAWAAFF